MKLQDFAMKPHDFSNSQSMYNSVVVHMGTNFRAVCAPHLSAQTIFAFTSWYVFHNLGSNFEHALCRQCYARVLTQRSDRTGTYDGT